MFLSMVAASNTVNAPLSRDAFERSFNVCRFAREESDVPGTFS